MCFPLEELLSAADEASQQEKKADMHGTTCATLALCVHMYIYIYICIQVCMNVCILYIYIYACMHLYILRICIHIVCIHTHINNALIWICLCTCVLLLKGIRGDVEMHAQVNPNSSSKGRT